MPKLIKRIKSIKEEKEQEILKAKVDKQEALIDYIAAMADVEIPEDEFEPMEGVIIDE